MFFLSNVAWPQYAPESGEYWPEDASSKCHTILQFEFCEKEEIPYIQAFMLLCQKAHSNEMSNYGTPGWKTGQVSLTRIPGEER